MCTCISSTREMLFLHVYRSHYLWIVAKRGDFEQLKTECSLLMYNVSKLNTVEPPTTDSPYYGNLHNADKGLQSRIIPYSFNCHCDLHIAETSLLWITDIVVTPQRTKSIQISLWELTVLTYWCINICCSWNVSIHSTMFQGLSVIKECSTFNHVVYVDWKWLSHYWVHSPYKGHLPVADASGVVPRCP